MHEEFKHQINRVKEVHFFIRPYLENCLRNQILTDEGRQFAGDYRSYYDLWTGTYSNKFFDMTTMIRLGSAIESCLKWYYMHKKGYSNLQQLKADPSYKQGIFQRVQPRQNQGGVIDLFQDELQYDLTNNPKLPVIQETMLHRHLYAHNSGLLDEKYCNSIKEITGHDIVADPTVSVSYPSDDTYWFEPLKRLDDLINGTEHFFRAFP